MALYIVDFEIDLITANYGFKLISNDVNLDAFNQFSFNAIQKLYENFASFLASILKTSAGTKNNYHAV